MLLNLLCSMHSRVYLEDTWQVTKNHVDYLRKPKGLEI